MIHNSLIFGFSLLTKRDCFGSFEPLAQSIYRMVLTVLRALMFIIIGIYSNWMLNLCQFVQRKKNVFLCVCEVIDFQTAIQKTTQIRFKRFLVFLLVLLEFGIKRSLSKWLSRSLDNFISKSKRRRNSVRSIFQY